MYCCAIDIVFHAEITVARRRNEITEYCGAHFSRYVHAVTVRNYCIIGIL